MPILQVVLDYLKPGGLATEPPAPIPVGPRVNEPLHASTKLDSSGALPVTLVICAGDAVVHHCQTIHRADSNTADVSSGLLRRTLGAVYRGVSCRVDQVHCRYLPLVIWLCGPRRYHHDDIVCGCRKLWLRMLRISQVKGCRVLC